MNHTSSAGIAAQFPRVLRGRIDDYFEEQGISDKGNLKMALKISGAILWWIGSYSLLFIAHWSHLQFLLLYIFHGISQGYMVLNIAHDANHKAISKKPWVNKLFSYSFDVCGINSYIWRILHHDGHHYCMNIEGEDETFFTRGWFRFSPYGKRKFIHRFQHIYVFFIYGFLTLDWMFVKDFEHFFFSSFKPSKEMKHPFHEYIIVFITKAFYFTYMIFIPVYSLGYSLLFILIAFVAAHFIIGFGCAFILQIAHPIESADFPKSSKEYDNFIYHVFATTADYLTESPFAIWLLGGLNLHCIHHIRTDVCHFHYPALTKIIKQTALEYDVQYRENITMSEALVKHIIWLKRMGSADEDIIITGLKQSSV